MDANFPSSGPHPPQDQFLKVGGEVGQYPPPQFCKVGGEGSPPSILECRGGVPLPRLPPFRKWNVASDTIDVASDTIGVASDTIDVAADTIDVASDTIDVVSDTIDVAAHTIDVASDLVKALITP